MTINRTSVNFGIVEGEFGLNQCFGRIIWSDPDPDPYQEALIWIRVAPKDYSGKKSIFTITITIIYYSSGIRASLSEFHEQFVLFRTNKIYFRRIKVQFYPF